MDQVLSHTSSEHPWFRESRLSRTNARADWYVWADPKRDGSPPNNWPSVFGGRAWEWNPSRSQYYFHNFLSEQPDLNFHNPAVQDAVLDVMRFWLERGVDGFRLDTVNYYFHDPLLRNNPPARRPKHLPYAVNPYDMQEHRYGKSQPDNIAFLKRVRSSSPVPGTTTVGEIGDSHRDLQLMEEYTAGREKLHMAYTFDMLGNEFTAAFSHEDRKVLHRRAERLADGPSQPRRAAPCDALGAQPPMRVRWRGRPSPCCAASAARSVSIRAKLGLAETDLLFEERRSAGHPLLANTRAATAAQIPWEEGEAPNGLPPARRGSRSAGRRSTSQQVPTTRCSTSTAGCSPSAAPTAC